MSELEKQIEADLQKARAKAAEMAWRALIKDPDLLTEIEALRERIAAVRALHVEEIDRGDPTGYCCDCEQRYPCNTTHALGGAA